MNDHDISGLTKNVNIHSTFRTRNFSLFTAKQKFNNIQFRTRAKPEQLEFFFIKHHFLHLKLQKGRINLNS